PQIGFKRQFLGLAVVAALLHDLLPPPRRHRLVQRPLQVLRPHDGFERASHGTPLAAPLLLAARCRSYKLVLDCGLWSSHTLTLPTALISFNFLTVNDIVATPPSVTGRLSHFTRSCYAAWLLVRNQKKRTPRLGLFREPV